MQLYSTGKISIDMDEKYEKPIVQNKTYHVPGGGDFSRFYILYVVPPVRVVYHVFFFLLLPCVLQACVFLFFARAPARFLRSRPVLFSCPALPLDFAFCERRENREWGEVAMRWRQGAHFLQNYVVFKVSGRC